MGGTACSLAIQHPGGRREEGLLGSGVARPIRVAAAAEAVFTSGFPRSTLRPLGRGKARRRISDRRHWQLPGRSRCGQNVGERIELGDLEVGR
jgi:hypothetical protein